MMDLYVYQWLGNESIFLFVCSVVLTLAVTWYVLSFSRIKKSSESLNNVQNAVRPTIPGPEPSDPQKGNLDEITEDGGLHRFTMSLHKQYGPIAAFWWGEKKIVSLASPDIWKDIQGLFDRPPELFRLFEPLFGQLSINYTNGPEGRRRRKTIDRSFSHSAVKEYYDEFIKAAQELADKWESLPEEEHIPLGESMMSIAIRSIAVTGMGKTFSQKEEILKFTHAYEECWSEMERRLDGTLPELGSDRENQFEKAKSYMRNIFKEMVTKRREKPDKKEHLFIDCLIEAEFLSENEVCDDTGTFLVGGFHTTGNMMVWCIYYLAFHPDIQEKVYKEMIEILGEETIDANVSSELYYTRKVLDETLRTAVVAPWAARVYEYDLPVGKYTIPAETPIFIPLGVVLQDSRIYPEPQKFNPDRFNAEEVRKRPSLAYQPFGFAGKRKCPAWRFSLAEGVVFLSVLCRKFKFHLVDGQTVEPVHGFVTSPKEEIWITVSKRK